MCGFGGLRFLRVAMAVLSTPPIWDDVEPDTFTGGESHNDMPSFSIVFYTVMPGITVV